MKNIFKDKNIIVTGGASGIGESLVTQLEVLGANVAVIDRSPKQEAGALYIQADMADIDQATAAFEKLTHSMERIDFVINGAGIFMGGEIRDTPIENWHEVIDNNIYAIGHGAQLAYGYMTKQQSGHIINIASTAGLIPVPAMGIYGSTKYALVGLSHAMRNEGAALNVKVSVACPTVVDTPLYDTAIYNKVNKDRILRSRTKLQTADVAARKILKGIMKSKATIHTARTTHAAWVLSRISPALYDFIARKIIRTYRAEWRIK